MARIFITGIAGFIASHLADYLAAKGHDVSGCDNLSTGYPDNVVGHQWRRLAIEDITKDDLTGIDIVYHTAALAYEGLSSFSPSLIARNIYAGSAAVFSAAIAAGVETIVNCSSMARYGEPTGKQPFVETDEPIPVDPYGIAKLAAERLLINLCETHRRKWTVVVPHNVYGPRQKYDDPYRNVCAIMANRMLQGQQPIIYGDGSQMRCFSFVSDVVPTLARMGFEAAASGEIINVGPDEGAVNILTLAHMLAEVIGCDCDPIFVPGRPREVKHAVCSSDKARRLLGFEQKVRLYDGLHGLVEWIRERGTRPFDYHINLEIRSEITPETWTKRSI